MPGFARPSLRLAIHIRDSFTCVYCQQAFDPLRVKPNGVHPELELDHMDPQLNGGGSNATNLMTSCLPCNDLKHGKQLADFCVRAGLDIEVVRRRVYLAQRRRLTRSRQKALGLLQIFKVEKDARCPWCETTCMTCFTNLAKKQLLGASDADPESRDHPGPDGLLDTEEGRDQDAAEDGWS